MDDLAVAGRCSSADAVFRFEDDDLASGEREPTSDGQADNACADDDGIDADGRCFGEHVRHGSCIVTHRSTRLTRT